MGHPECLRFRAHHHDLRTPRDVDTEDYIRLPSSGSSWIDARSDGAGPADVS